MITALPGTSINSRTHPLEYNSWRAMIERCENRNSIGYDTYGAVGIKVCKRWRLSFATFVQDMGLRPSRKHSIDRHPDPYGDYKPSNCRWATAREQRINQRPQDDHARVLKSWTNGKRSRLSPFRIDLTGKVFGKLTVVEYSHTKTIEGTTYAYWQCKCTCGNKSIIQGSSLKCGATKSCGCAKLDGLRQHARSRTAEQQRALALKGWETKRKNRRIERERL
jgi:hypothetical protein